MRILKVVALAPIFATIPDNADQLLKDLHKKMMLAEKSLTQFVRRHSLQETQPDTHKGLLKEKQRLLWDLFYYRDSYVNLLDRLTQG